MSVEKALLWAFEAVVAVVVFKGIVLPFFSSSMGHLVKAVGGP